VESVPGIKSFEEMGILRIPEHAGSSIIMRLQKKKADVHYIKKQDVIKHLSGIVFF